MCMGFHHAGMGCCMFVVLNGNIQTGLAALIGSSLVQLSYHKLPACTCILIVCCKATM